MIYLTFLVFKLMNLFWIGVVFTHFNQHLSFKADQEEYLTLFRMGLFGSDHGWGEPIRSHISYDPIVNFLHYGGTVTPYLKKSGNQISANFVISRNRDIDFILIYIFSFFKLFLSLQRLFYLLNNKDRVTILMMSGKVDTLVLLKIKLF